MFFKVTDLLKNNQKFFFTLNRSQNNENKNKIRMIILMLGEKSISGRTEDIF